MVTTTQNNENLNQVQGQASPRNIFIKEAKLVALVAAVAISLIALTAVAFLTAPVLLPAVAIAHFIGCCGLIFLVAARHIGKDEPSSEQLDQKKNL